MRIKILIAALVLAIAPAASARELQRGYRGFVDANVDLSFRSSYFETWIDVYYGVSTSHGYQLNPHFFLGAGVAWEQVMEHSWHKREYPYFVQARTDWTFGKVPLYADVRVGGVLFGDYRLYLSPTVGYRLDWGKRMALNFGLGVTLRGYGWSDTKTLHPQLSVRVGVEF